MSTPIITKTYAGHPMHFRAKDGWLNATKAAHIYGKRLSRFWAQAELDHLRKDTAFVQITAGRNGGTWLSPDMSNLFARWLDTDLAGWLLKTRSELLIEVQALTKDSPDSYTTLAEFKERNGYKLDQSCSSRLTAKARELTLAAGQDVRKHNAPYGFGGSPSQVNAYPNKYWWKALELLRPKLKFK